MRPFLKTKDFSFSGEEFDLMLDPEFNMLKTQPEPKNLEDYYDSESYISHKDSGGTLIEKLYQYVKRYSIKRKVDLINAYGNHNKKLLDIGAGTGSFLEIAKKKDWETYGIEPNEIARDLAADKGLSIKENIDSIKEDGFQVITMWHVLEHLSNLDTQIDKIRSLLKEDGTLILAVPNFQSYDAKYYKQYWAAYDVPRHLSHFSQKAIKLIFAKHGMKVIKVKPMIFDSFYVSLLSEKYKWGKVNFIRAFFIGLRSNLRAWKTKEYSSLIYILKND